MSVKYKLGIIVLMLTSFLFFESYYGPIQMYAGLMKENDIEENLVLKDEPSLLMMEKIDVEMEEEIDEEEEKQDVEKDDKEIVEEELDENFPEDNGKLEETTEEEITMEEQESKEFQEDEHVLEEENAIENEEIMEEVVVEEKESLQSQEEEQVEEEWVPTDDDEEIAEAIEVEEIVDDESEVEEQPLNAITPQQGLTGITILNNPNLSASLSLSGQGQKVITLVYEGRSLLDIGLLEETYIIFNIPTEIVNMIYTENLSGSYVVPGILLPSSGNFEPDDFEIVGNQVVIDFKRLLTLSILGRYEFTLHIELDSYLPLAPTGEYTFISQATKQLIDLTLLADPLAYATLAGPVLEFHSVSTDIPFQTTTIPTQSTLIRREDALFTISVRDTRGSGAPWSIQAHIDQPLTLQSNPSFTLDEALKFYRNNGDVVTLNESPQQIYSGETGTSEITTIQWGENEGPLIYVEPHNVRVGEYATNITWTLVDAP